MNKFVKVLLVANLCLWIYFWIGFARESYPYRPNPPGHPAGTGYTFWGHSIAVVESGLKYPFLKTAFYLELPSFVVAVLVERIFDSRMVSRRFITGISVAGWTLVGTMLLSFLQWYFVGWMGQKFWKRWLRDPAGGPNQATASTAVPRGGTRSRS